MGSTILIILVIGILYLSVQAGKESISKLTAWYRQRRQPSMYKLTEMAVALLQAGNDPSDILTQVTAALGVPVRGRLDAIKFQDVSLQGEEGRLTRFLSDSGLSGERQIGE